MSGSSGLYTRRRRKIDINIVPLMDVLTILIFFFLVSMQFRERLALNLTLPKIETAGQSTTENSLTIGIDREGVISVNGREASREELTALMREVASINTEVVVLLRADENTSLKETMFVMDACRKVGLNNIRILSRGE